MAPRPAVLLTALWLCLYGASPAWSECNNATQLSVQLDTLLAEYDREAPPAAPVAVELALDVRHATIDHQHAVMRLLADLKMTWKEPRVQWNVTEWGCGSVLTSAERLWLPDIVVLNAAATSADGGRLRARLDAAGAVAWITRLDITAPVALALHDWPRDTQTCTFKFGSRAYNNDELMINISSFKHTVVFEAGLWEIKGVIGEESSWLRGDEEMSVAAWTVQVARRAPAHALATGAVLLAGALLLATGAALPPHQRHPLAACASFTAALWLITALVRLPEAHSTPRAMCVMCALCVCGAASAAGAALAGRLPRCTAPPPRALCNMLSTLSNVCKLTPSPESCESSARGAWAAAGVLADRVLSGALLLTLLVLLAVQLF